MQDGWGEWDRRGGLIAPDGAGGTPPIEYTTLGRWALLPAQDHVLQAWQCGGCYLFPYNHQVFSWYNRPHFSAQL